MTPASTPRCRSCRAPVIWAMTEDGRWTPVDAEPTDTGNLVLRGGNPPRVRVVDLVGQMTARREQIALYASHFATCPHAAEHRRNRVGGNAS